MWALAASACVLAGLLLLSLRGRFAPAVAPAQAAMVATPGGSYVFMTARLRGNDERLFVIDNPRHSLLVYDIDENDQRLVPELVQDLEPVFAAISGQPVEAPTQRLPR